MSPSTTLMSCGTSSKLERRKSDPTLVIRGSWASLKLFCSSFSSIRPSTYALMCSRWTDSSASVTIERNLYTWKTRRTHSIPDAVRTGFAPTRS